MVELADSIWRDFVTDGVPATGKQKPKKIDIRAWGTYLETLAGLAYTSGQVYSLKATLVANLVPGAHTPALVVGDPTPGNDGLYEKIGATTTGSWSQRTTFVPGCQFIKAVDAGAGTPNAIIATSSLAISSTSGVQFIRCNIFEANTSSPVTITFNGNVGPLTIKTASGNDVSANGLVAGGTILGTVEGSTFRLLSDQASAAIQAAAELARDAAAASAASAAADAASLSPASLRERLSAVKNLYVRTDGSDANNGLANTSGGALLTIQAAVTKAYKLFDPSTYQIVINVADGTYAGNVVVYGVLPYGGSLKFSCSATPDSVIINATGAAFDIGDGAKVQIEGGFHLNATTFGISANYRTTHVLFKGVTFGTGMILHVWSTRFAYVEAYGDYYIAGDATNHLQTSHHGNFRRSAGKGIFTADCTFTFFMNVLGPSEIVITGTGISTSGGVDVYDRNGHTITGQRYIAQLGFIQWPTAEEDFIPGSLNGVDLNGGALITEGDNDSDRDAGYTDYNLATASGNLNFVTTQGFRPGRIDWMASKSGAANETRGWSLFNQSGVKNHCMSTIAGVSFHSNSYCLIYYVDGSNYVTFTMTAQVVGGWTVAAVKTGSPTGTLRIYWIAERGR